MSIALLRQAQAIVAPVVLDDQFSRRSQQRLTGDPRGCWVVGRCTVVAAFSRSVDLSSSCKTNDNDSH